MPFAGHKTNFCVCFALQVNMLLLYTLQCRWEGKGKGRKVGGVEGKVKWRNYLPTYF